MVFYVVRKRAESPTSAWSVWPAVHCGSLSSLSSLGTALVLMGLAGFAEACSRGQPTFKDTEGRTYQATCNEQGCTIKGEADAGPGAPPGLGLRSPGRIVGICKDAEGRPTTPLACRPLVCTGDSACPPAHGLKHGTCVNGLCTEPANSIQVADAVMLCLAGTGWGQGSPAQVERFAMALNCGSPCRIPSPCRQP